MIFYYYYRPDVFILVARRVQNDTGLFAAAVMCADYASVDVNVL